jgi:hypothetical protein
LLFLPPWPILHQINLPNLNHLFMKPAHTLVLLAALAALSLTSCGQDWHHGYTRVPVGGTFYSVNGFNNAPSFGGYGGGYGNGYSVWPQPTLNYGENFTYEDVPTNVGNSWEHGDPMVPARVVTRSVTQSQVSYEPARISGK